MKQILKLRADEEEVKLSGNALTLLTTMAEKHSLRYALQLIANADIVRQRQKRDVVCRVFIRPELCNFEHEIFLG